MENFKYYEAIAEIMKAGHRITEQVSSLLKPFNMTEPQYSVMRILEDSNGTALTVQEIQEQMYRKSSNVSRIVDKLLDKKLVNRDLCKTNRRKVEITLTIEGIELLVKLNEVVHHYHDPMRSHLDDEECVVLMTLLRKLDVADL